jgi:vacuolar-type H+-ATPase subunit H
MDLDELLDELEATVERGERFWHLFGGRAMVRADDIYDLAHRLRSSIPEDVRTVSDAGRERERIIQEAHNERAKIIAAAREQANLLLDNDQLVIEAQQKRDQLLQQARIESDGIRADAEDYARNVITKVGEYIARIAASVDQTREMLERDAEAEKQRRSGEQDTAM